MTVVMLQLMTTVSFWMFCACLMFYHFDNEDIYAGIDNKYPFPSMRVQRDQYSILFLESNWIILVTTALYDIYGAIDDDI